jgi:hypothetical protein
VSEDQQHGDRLQALIDPSPLGELDRDRRAAGQCLHGGAQAAIGEHCRVQAARRLSQLFERERQLLAGVREDAR